MRRSYPQSGRRHRRVAGAQSFQRDPGSRLHRKIFGADHAGEGTLESERQGEPGIPLFEPDQGCRHGRTPDAPSDLGVGQPQPANLGCVSCHERDVTYMYPTRQAEALPARCLPIGKRLKHTETMGQVNELSERALAWLRLFVESRGNPSRASKELGFAKNWAWRQIEGEKPCNWDFDTLGKIAAAVNLTPMQLQDAIRAGIVPAPRVVERTPRAKQRRAPGLRAGRAQGRKSTGG